MQRLAQGDESALSELFERHGSSVYGLARKVVSDAQLAEEVLQDAFLRVARESRRAAGTRRSKSAISCTICTGGHA